MVFKKKIIQNIKMQSIRNILRWKNEFKLIYSTSRGAPSARSLWLAYILKIVKMAQSEKIKLTEKFEKIKN